MVNLPLRDQLIDYEVSWTEWFVCMIAKVFGIRFVLFVCFYSNALNYPTDSHTLQ